MKFLVGCPAYGRNWILPTWFEYVEKACDANGVTPSYVFALEASDEDTLACIDAHAGMYDRSYATVSVLAHPGPSLGPARNWHQPARLHHMVELRNEMLSEVRKVSPDMFLSLDSDILITGISLEKAIRAISSEGYDAVSSGVYLGKGKGVTNAAYYDRKSGLKRCINPYLAKVDILMAYKLMNTAAYGVDYCYNNQGEDIGWSLACKEAGLKLGFDGSSFSKHVMEEEDLQVYDKRVGY